MSVDYEVYFGPYVEVTTKMVETKATVHACSNPNCGNFQRTTSQGPYCSKCGQEITGCEVDEMTSQPDIDQFIEDDEFCTVLMPVVNDCTDHLNRTQNLWVFTPNQIDAPGTLFYVKEESGYRDVHPGAMDADTDYLEALPETQRLREYFGDENVRVKWGVLNWAC